MPLHKMNKNKKQKQNQGTVLRLEPERHCIVTLMPLHKMNKKKKNQGTVLRLVSQSVEFHRLQT